MASKLNHKRRSRKTGFLKQPVFKSKDMAFHEISAGKPVFKEHKKKY